MHHIIFSPSLLNMAFDMQSLGSLLVTIFFIRSLIIEFVPQRLLASIKRAVQERLLPSTDSFMVIEEFDYQGYSETFEHALKYLSYRFSDSAAVVRVADDSTSSRGYSFAIDINQTLHDEVDGVVVRWSFRVKESLLLGRSGTNRVRYLELSFGKKHATFVRHDYFPSILRIARQQEASGRARKLYTNSSSGDRGSLWSSVVFDHPSTFATLAFDPELKASLMNDLTQFTAKGDYYKRVGRTWKRGYLIYGPPGTGKTSLIAAMANYLEFDVYDLELSAVTCNSQLRRLLLETRRRSLIVIEDIDRSIYAMRSCSGSGGGHNRGKARASEKWEDYDRGFCSDNNNHCFGDIEVEDDAWSGTGELSLSGILNFMDGLWSSCGQERLMVVTTNHKDRLDPALLRPGRLDVHIHLSYCGVLALRALATNYLYPNEEREEGKEARVDGGHGGYRGEEWKEVEGLVGQVNVTPATVAETFLGSATPGAARSQLAVVLHQDATRNGKKRKEEQPRCHSAA